MGINKAIGYHLSINNTGAVFSDDPNPYLVLLIDQVTVIGYEMCVSTSRFANMCAQIKQI